MSDPKIAQHHEIDTGKRGFLRRSSGALLSASAVALIAGCESIADSQGSRDASGDVAILNFALGLEHEAIGVYEVAAGSGLLTSPVLDAATVFLGHHRQHRDTLAGVIGRMGGEPVAAKPNSAYVEKLDLGALRSEADVLKLAHELERQAANAYLGAVPKFGDGDLAHAAARISADEVMHFTVLTRVMGGELPIEALTFGA
jgi:hypothetical protein